MTIFTYLDWIQKWVVVGKVGRNVSKWVDVSGWII